MRKIPLTSAVIAVLGLTAVGLTACSQPTTGACPRPAADASLAELVTVSDDLDAEPDIELYTPLHQSATGSVDIVVGEGAPIETDAQVVVLDLTLLSGADGEKLLQGTTRPAQLKDLTTAIPGLSDGLRCATEGTRTVIALAPDDLSPQAADSAGLAEGDSAVAVVDVRQVYLARANGADVFNSDSGLPTVVRATDGRPGLVIPDSAAPADLVVQTIKRGDGPAVTGEAPVRVHYTSVDWSTRTQLQTTWDSAPAAVAFGPDAPAFAEALEGQTVGSQVMIVVPAGEDGGSAVVYVVDILGIDATATR